MSEHGLWELTTERLRDLDEWLGRRRGDEPVGALELPGNGFTEKGGGALVGLSTAAARAVIRTLLGERIHRPPAALELVWSGPDPVGAESRETRQVVGRLFETAEKSVIVAGFAFWRARDIFEPLHARASQRPLDLDFFIHIDATGMNQAMTASVFFAETWPWIDVVPRVFVDDRTPQAGRPAAARPFSMHAKCIVVDQAAVLVTSANFTDRAHDSNIELGVLVRDATFAGRVAGHWRSLVTARLFRQL